MKKFIQSAFRGFSYLAFPERPSSWKSDPSLAILLDMDGVVNNDRNMFATGTTPYAGSCHPSDLDAVSVGIINKIKRLTGAQLILMSSWAINCNESKLDDISLMTGLPFDGFVTDDLTDSENRRGANVIQWLASNPQVKKFVVIDDEFNHHNSTYHHCVVEIDPCVGITAHHLGPIGKALGVNLWQLAIEEKNRGHTLTYGGSRR